MDFDDTPSEPYQLSVPDRAIVAAAIELVQKLVRSTLPRPAEIVSLARVLHVLEALPGTSAAMTVSLTLTGPKRCVRDAEIFHWWEVTIDEHRVGVASGGHFHRESTGGDTFTAMTWSAEPASEPEFGDYLDQLCVVDDAKPFPDEVRELDPSEPGYSLEVTDEENPLLAEMADAEADEADETSKEPHATASMTAAEEALAVLADPGEAARQGLTYLNPPGQCGRCGCAFDERRYFVDGRLRDRPEWSCLCAECFTAAGAGIGWGVGQLFERQPDGEWLQVAGFRPKT